MHVGMTWPRISRRVLTGAVAMIALTLVTAAPALAQSTPRLIVDDFSQDRLATDYTIHAGGAMQVSNGVLRAGASTPDKVITHNASAGLVDTEVTLQVNFKANASNGTTGAILKFLSPGNYLRLATTYSTSAIKVSKWENGGRTDLLNVGGLFTLAPNTTYWVRGRIEGNAISVSLWGTDPALGGNPIVSRNYTLSGTNATKFGAGVAGSAGIYLDPFDTVREFDNLRIAELAAPPPPPPPPPPTSAPTAVSTSGSAVIAAAAAGTVNGISVTRPSTTTIAVSDSAGVTAGAGCVQAAPTQATCANTSTTTLSSATVNAGDGDDQVTSAVKATIDGGAGADRLTGSGSSDSITGGPGDDVLAGGGGDDSFLEGSSPSGADTMDGGAGRDNVNYGGRTATVVVDLDGQADDGAAGEGDNTGTALENVTGGSAADTLTGNAAANQLQGSGGNDTLSGLAGSDSFWGAAGNDTINARDLDLDSGFSCGENTNDRDVVNADLSPNDPVTADPTRCEVVNKT
jgi:Ca2+-binding RTX toxin-like protein